MISYWMPWLGLRPIAGPAASRPEESVCGVPTYDSQLGCHLGPVWITGICSG